ncbi:MAG: hypothetical protein BroJett024_19040 [Alphaproteobacteria bacterium]|nr:MAG: hypothetical protein BroJett024_19040 [Alphaproteobacteria bacterium]
MNETSTRLRLDGLEPDNLLAFIALLGLLRALETVRPQWQPRAAWDLDRPPLRPILALAQGQTSRTVCDAAAEGLAVLAEDYAFPAGVGDEAPQKDLNYSEGTARTLLAAAMSEGGRRADLWAALMCDKAAKDDKIEATPLCLLFGQGHQHFLDRLASVPRMEAPPSRGRGKTAVALTAAETLHKALFEPWTRQDPTPSFRWDPAEDVRYALRADDPSGDKSTTQHGANRLAAIGLAVLTATPAQRGKRVRLQVLGGEFEHNEFVFRWPVWSDPASAAAIRALLSHPRLADGASALSHLGVTEVRQARRISVGKFMNFTRAEPTTNP